MFSVVHVTCYMLQVPDNIPPAAGPGGDNILLEEGGPTFAPLTSRPGVGDMSGQCVWRQFEDMTEVTDTDRDDEQSVSKWCVCVRCKSVVRYSIVAAICSSPQHLIPPLGSRG